MKFFLAFAAIVAVATASAIKPIDTHNADLEAIIAAINSPSTHPATALLLEQQLLDILGVGPISVGPAIVEESPISVGPALVDFPLPDGGAAAPVQPVQVSPVQTPAASAPLVQIILNIGPPGSVSIVPDLVSVPEKPELPAIVPNPVIVVDEAQEPIIVQEPTFPEPIIVVEPEILEPILPEPVLVDTPSINPSPAVVLPEELN